VIIVAVVGDLMLASRIEAIAARLGAGFRRVDSPAELPPAESLVLVVVDWSERKAGWGESLRAWRSSGSEARLLVVGPHLDADGHADARRYGIGPVRARSALDAQLTRLLTGRTAASKA
jgi:hypothetical protein